MQRGQLRARDDDALGIGSRRCGNVGIEATEGVERMVVEMWGEDDDDDGGGGSSPATTSTKPYAPGLWTRTRTRRSEEQE